MINDVYNARILALAADIPRLGRLPAPQASARAHSRLCGSTVTIDLVMDGDTVADFAHEVRACALGQASSSLMASHIIGASAQELREVRDTMWKMLRENGPPPAGRWEDFKVLEPVRGGGRHRPDRGGPRGGGISVTPRPSPPPAASRWRRWRLPRPDRRRFRAPD